MKDEKIPQWRIVQRSNFTQIDPLISYLQIGGENKNKILSSSKFVLNLPFRLAEKIEKNNLSDPIFLQFVPLVEENMETPGFVLDPVQDRSFCKTAKMLQKYQGRALVIATSACVMHCRFCFRQNFPYETQVLGFEDEIRFLQNDSSIHEVILSGGDPLSLGDFVLRRLFKAFEEIPHIKRIRFHTRFPIGIPERIDESFLSILESSSKQIYFVLHSNHPKELDEEVLSSMKKMQKLGVVLLNQSVLLKGVNDREEVLLELCEKLITAGILPYYLHQLDLVKGAAHFKVSEERALELVQYLQKNLSGFAIPRLVKEEAGKQSKTFVY